MPALDIENEEVPQHSEKSQVGPPELRPCVCRRGRQEDYGWMAVWRFILTGWDDEDRDAQEDAGTRIYVRQEISIDTYLYDSVHSLCWRDLRTFVDLFRVDPDGSVPMLDTHGYISPRLDPKCPRHCLMVSFVSGRAQLVRIRSSVPPSGDRPPAHAYAGRSRQLFDKAGAEVERDDDPGTTRRTYTTVPHVHLAYDYAAEVQHCGAPGSLSVVPTDEVVPATAKDNPFPPGTGPYRRNQRPALLRGTKEATDEGGRESDPEPLLAAARDDRPPTMAKFAADGVRTLTGALRQPAPGHAVLRQAWADRGRRRPSRADRFGSSQNKLAEAKK